MDPLVKTPALPHAFQSLWDFSSKALSWPLGIPQRPQDSWLLAAITPGADRWPTQYGLWQHVGIELPFFHLTAALSLSSLSFSLLLSLWKSAVIHPQNIQGAQVTIIVRGHRETGQGDGRWVICPKLPGRSVDTGVKLFPWIRLSINVECSLPSSPHLGLAPCCLIRWLSICPTFNPSLQRME